MATTRGRRSTRKKKEEVVEEAPKVEEVIEPKAEEPAPEPVQEEVKAEPKKPLSGVAAAMAKSRSVKQEKEKTAREMQQSQSGVKRI